LISFTSLKEVKTMGWKETRVMDQKQKFVFRALDSTVRMSEACREFEISRKTGYKWLRRFEECGKVGLMDLSRRPMKCPGETSREMILAIVEVRVNHGTW
jgi:transposase-like protein